jgi:hypothetical protein
MTVLSCDAGFINRTQLRTSVLHNSSWCVRVAHCGLGGVGLCCKQLFFSFIQTQAILEFKLSIIWYLEEQ